MSIILYDYWRSSAAYRVRIALNLKGIAYETRTVDIKPGADEQKSAAYRILNPQMRVPAIEVDGDLVGQSMAIIEYLEEMYPAPSLLPDDRVARLRCRAFADVIASDVHPLNNLSVLATLRTQFSADDAQIKTWYASWIQKGFAALEAVAEGLSDTPFLFGDAPTLAEIALVPQVYNAGRYDVDVSPYPRLLEIDARCRALPAFIAAAPKAG